ncbi:hypothetical protein [Terriglobus albidus]|uniref:hypothetical protein n=1 Tax=Terriglobus albidus TaxID=1592106 RepID=UPI0021DFF81D|nr:hypothetical protein [Terriglobus albidus]
MADLALNHSYDLLRPIRSQHFQLGHAQVDQFLVFSDLPDNAVAMRTGVCLAPYKSSLIRDFKMELPNDMVLVYALPIVGSVNEYAEALHRLQLPPGTVAYSVYEDLSIVGMGGEESCGTLAHELTHLMIRGNFGDAPAWLEEGLASEIAVGIPSVNSFLFEKSWRDEMLQKEWSQRPSLATLIDGGWDMYQAKSQDDLQRAAAVNAMAACFVRYLDKQGVLREVYSQIKNQGSDAEQTPQVDQKEILQSALRKPFAEIEQNFSVWFSDEMKPAPSRPAAARHSAKPSVSLKGTGALH